MTDHFDGQINSVKILPFHLASHISLYLENVAITDLLNYPACLNGLLDICAKQGEFVSNHLIFLWFSYYDRSVQSKQLQYSAASREGSIIFLYDLGYKEWPHFWSTLEHRQLKEDFWWQILFLIFYCGDLWSFLITSIFEPLHFLKTEFFSVD